MYGAAEAFDTKNCLHRSFQQTFNRTGLYQGHLWFDVGSQLPGAPLPLHRSARPHDDDLTDLRPSAKSYWPVAALS
jgi:hypothetical protein